MESKKTLLLAFQIAKTVMLIGTGVMAGIFIRPFVAELPPIFAAMATFAVIAIAVLMLDGVGWDLLIDAGRAANKQDFNAPKDGTIALMAILGLACIGGSVGLSLKTAAPAARVIANDKSGEVERLERLRASSQRDYQARLKSAEQAVSTAQAQYDAAKARFESADKDAAASIGGQLGRDLRAGNTWARKQRPYTSFVENRTAEYAEAATALKQATDARARILEQGATDETTSAVVAGVATLMKDADEARGEFKGTFVYIQLAACLLAFICAVLLFQFHALPNDRTILQVSRDLALTASNAVVVALDAGQKRASEALAGGAQKRNSAGAFHAQQRPAFSASETATFSATNCADNDCATDDEKRRKTIGFKAETVAPSQQKAQQRGSATMRNSATANPQYRSAQSAIRNARSAMKKAQQAYEQGAITAQQLSATLATKQAAIQRNELRAQNLIK